jgi:hypothetical protein
MPLPLHFVSMLKRAIELMTHAFVSSWGACDARDIVVMRAHVLCEAVDASAVSPDQRHHERFKHRARMEHDIFVRHAYLGSRSVHVKPVQPNLT